MKKTIFGFICAILMVCGFASCGNVTDGETTTTDSTEVVNESTDSVCADSAVTVETVAQDSVA